ncbi:hypothetical protein A9Q96_03705 [Rhodobacterales bacterium 52_120_T64]|nr:hypothetical protein A9Q96_03705 [Rhodobacterales bacterium 52_120_T64]
MICITICTRERPIMLRRVLESCTEIKPDYRSELQFIVVENGPAAGGADIVTEFTSRLAISYVHEPNVGVVCARNAGIEAFLKTDADWMATIDDDEIVSENWLIAMLDAIDRYPQCKTFAGPQNWIQPKTVNKWLRVKPKSNPETGTPFWNASTANALFRRSVFDANKIGLRFNPVFNLSGGEDTHLFFELKDMGEDVLWVREAECFEPLVLERTYFRNRAKRTIQAAQNWGLSIIIREGNFRGGGKVLSYCLTCAVNFVTFGVCGAFIGIFRANTGQAILNKSLATGCHAIGYFKAIFLPLGMQYEQIDGE